MCGGFGLIYLCSGPKAIFGNCKSGAESGEWFRVLPLEAGARGRDFGRFQKMILDGPGLTGAIFKKWRNPLRLKMS